MYELRPASPADAAFLYQLERDGSGLHLDPSGLQIIRADDEDVGFLHLESTPAGVVLAGMSLVASHRGRGIGTAILSDVITSARNAGKPLRVSVAAPNRARALFERFGFAVTRAGEARIEMSLSPRAVTESDLPYGENFHDPVAARAWSDAANVKRPHRREFFEAFASELGSLSRCERILELGSGPGFLAEHVLAACPRVRDYVLFDFSDPMLALARERLRPFAERARFVRADFRASDWSAVVPGPFDAVLSMQAIHELRHKRHAHRLYEEVARLLADGGALLICDHNPGSDPCLERRPLYMTVEEKQLALCLAGFRDVRACLVLEKMALVRGTKGVGG